MDERTAQEAFYRRDLNVVRASLRFIAASFGVLGALWLLYGFSMVQLPESSLTETDAVILLAMILAPATLAAFLLRRFRERIDATAAKAWPSLGAIVWLLALAGCVLQASYFWDDAEYGEAFYRGHVLDRTSLVALAGAAYGGILVSVWAIGRRPSPLVGAAALLAILWTMWASDLLRIWLGL
jgi:predicted Abi (CAAX) family protease